MKPILISLLLVCSAQAYGNDDHDIRRIPLRGGATVYVYSRPRVTQAELDQQNDGAPPADRRHDLDVRIMEHNGFHVEGTGFWHIELENHSGDEESLPSETDGCIGRATLTTLRNANSPLSGAFDRLAPELRRQLVDPERRQAIKIGTYIFLPNPESFGCVGGVRVMTERERNGRGGYAGAIERLVAQFRRDIDSFRTASIRAQDQGQLMWGRLRDRGADGMSPPEVDKRSALNRMTETVRQLERWGVTPELTSQLRATMQTLLSLDNRVVSEGCAALVRSVTTTAIMALAAPIGMFLAAPVLAAGSFTVTGTGLATQGVTAGVLVRQAVTGAAFVGGTDALNQAAAMADGVQNEFHVGQTLTNTAIGAVVGPLSKVSPAIAGAAGVSGLAGGVYEVGDHALQGHTWSALSNTTGLVAPLVFGRRGENLSGRRQRFPGLAPGEDPHLTPQERTIFNEMLQRPGTQNIGTVMPELPRGIPTELVPAFERLNQIMARPRPFLRWMLLLDRAVNLELARTLATNAVPTDAQRSQALRRVILRRAQAAGWPPEIVDPSNYPGSDAFRTMLRDGRLFLDNLFQDAQRHDGFHTQGVHLLQLLYASEALNISPGIRPGIMPDLLRFMGDNRRLANLDWSSPALQTGAGPHNPRWNDSLWYNLFDMDSSNSRWTFNRPGVYQNLYGLLPNVSNIEHWAPPGSLSRSPAVRFSPLLVPRVTSPVSPEDEEP